MNRYYDDDDEDDVVSKSQTILPRKRNFIEIASNEIKIVKSASAAQTSESESESGAPMSSKNKQQFLGGEIPKDNEKDAEFLHQEKVWNSYFNALVSYGEDKQTCNIQETFQYQLSDGNIINLGGWLENQRALNRDSQLPPDRYQKLQDLVDKNLLTWDKSQSLDDYWKLVFGILVRVLAKHKGFYSVPYSCYVTLDDKTKIYLGNWLFYQHQQHFEGKLPQDRLLRFQELIDQDKLVWNMSQIIRRKKLRDEKWEVYYKYLLQYGKKHNEYVNAPINTVVKLPGNKKIKLGKWLVLIRALHRYLELSSYWEEKFQILVDGGKFSW